MPADHETATTNAPQGAPAANALDEAARRRPGFEEGSPIEMTNGQRWHVPRPHTVLIPEIGEEANPTLAHLGGDLARIRATPILEDRIFMGLLAMIQGTIKGTDLAQVYGAASAAVIRLLKRNYDITLSEAIGLIPPLDGASPASVLSSLLNAVLGAAPQDAAA